MKMHMHMYRLGEYKVKIIEYKVDVELWKMTRRLNRLKVFLKKTYHLCISP